MQFILLLYKYDFSFISFSSLSFRMRIGPTPISFCGGKKKESKKKKSFQRENKFFLSFSQNCIPLDTILARRSTKLIIILQLVKTLFFTFNSKMLFLWLIESLFGRFQRIIKSRIEFQLNKTVCWWQESESGRRKMQNFIDRKKKLTIFCN